MKSQTFVGILDYGAGNHSSVVKSFEYLEAKVEIISNPKNIKYCSHIVLPGVGSFFKVINLIKKYEWDSHIKEFQKEGKPILGICLGMQMLFTRSSEDGESKGLDLIPGDIDRFSFDTSINKLRIPHVGFNTVTISKESFLFKNLSNELDFYFTHSYRAICADNFISGKAEYGEEFAAAVEKGCVFGTQFHPEKSQINGLNLLKNFLNF